MKIISWNVNWIRAVAKKWFKEFIVENNPDILCIQETKAFEDQFKKELWEIKWYKYIWHSWERAWYAWTAIFYKDELKVIDTKNHFDEVEHFHNDWRVTEIELEDFVLFNWYFPNWWTRANWDEMLTYKIDFYNKLIDYSRRIKASGKNIILTWDFNICHTEIDIARPKENKNSIWFLPIEREKIWELINDWNIDVFRHLYPDTIETYSWWSYRAAARARNIGRRIDYFVVNNQFTDKIKDIKYMTDTMWSDHCPIMLELK